MTPSPPPTGPLASERARHSRAVMTAAEADFIRHLGATFRGEHYRHASSTLRALSAGADRALRQGLAAHATRYLLRQGGVRAGVAFVHGARTPQHRFWQGGLHLRFTGWLLNMLLRLHRTSEIGGPAPPGGPLELATGDEVVLLMLAEAALDREIQLVSGGGRLFDMGYLTPLYYHHVDKRPVLGRGEPPLAEVSDPGLGELMFALRPLLLHSLLRSESLLLTMDGPRAGAVARRRAGVLSAYVHYVRRSERYELLEPICRAMVHRLKPGFAGRACQAVARQAGARHVSARQAAFERVLPGWAVLDDMIALREHSRSLYYDDVDPQALRVLKHTLKTVGEPVWEEAAALLARLRFDV